MVSPRSSDISLCPVVEIDAVIVVWKAYSLAGAAVQPLLSAGNRVVPSVFGAAERGAIRVSKQLAPQGGKRTVISVLTKVVGLKALRFPEAPLL